MSGLQVRFTGSRWATYVNGPGASRLLSEVRDGKAPHWDVGKRAFIVTERVAGDFLALADAHGRRVQVFGQSETEAATQAGLW